jgi:hypothetical protein
VEANRELKQRRRDCERALTRAEQQLADACVRLDSLGRFGHRRERQTLQSEIAREAAAVRLARKQLTLLAVERERRRAHEPRRGPSRPTLIRARELDRSLRLEL